MEKCIYLYVYMSKQSISTLRTLKPKTGYGAIGEDLVAGADAAEKRKVFSLVGLGPKFFQGKMVGKPLAGVHSITSDWWDQTLRIYGKFEGFPSCLKPPCWKQPFF